MKIVYLLVLVCVFPLSLFAREDAQVTSAKVTEVGIYQAKVMVDSTNAAGIKLQGLDEFRLLKGTTNIPARIGVRFGFRYEIQGTPTNAPIALTMVGKHPPIKNSSTGKTETVETYPLKSWIGATYTSYSFDDESDLVPGNWTIEVWHEGKKLCEQSFLVVPDNQKKISPPSEPKQ